MARRDIPTSWKREAMFPIEKTERAVKIEKQRPIMLIEARRKAYRENVDNVMEFLSQICLYL